MGVFSVFENSHSTQVYRTKDGANCFTYTGEHSGSSSSGNAVIINHAGTGMANEVFIFDDEGYCIDVRGA